MSHVSQSSNLLSLLVCTHGGSKGTHTETWLCFLSCTLGMRAASSHRLVVKAGGINIKMSVGEQASVCIMTMTVLDVSAAEMNF